MSQALREYDDAGISSVTKAMACSTSIGAASLLGNRLRRDQANALLATSKGQLANVKGNIVSLCGLQPNQREAQIPLSEHMFSGDLWLLVSDMIRIKSLASVSLVSKNPKPLPLGGAATLTAAVKKCSHLRHLDLSGYTFDFGSLARIANAIASSTTLTGLVLEGQRELPVQALAGHQPPVTKTKGRSTRHSFEMDLSLDQRAMERRTARLTAKSAFMIGALLKFNADLTKLQLSNNDVAASQEGGIMAIIDALSHERSRVRELSLSGNELVIPSGNYRTLDRLISAQSLRKLFLDGIYIGSKGAVHVADALQLSQSSLFILSLAGCNLADVGEESIKRVYELDNLKTPDGSHTDPRTQRSNGEATTFTFKGSEPKSSQVHGDRQYTVFEHEGDTVSFGDFRGAQRLLEALMNTPSVQRICVSRNSLEEFAQLQEDVQLNQRKHGHPQGKLQDFEFSRLFKRVADRIMIDPGQPTDFVDPKSVLTGRR